MRKEILVGAGLLALGILAVVGIGRAAHRTLLPALAPDRRKALLIGMARMRPLPAAVVVPGAIEGRTTAVELRSTTPASWGESALAWIEHWNNEGYAVAYWEAEDADHTVLVAVTEAEEPGLVPYAHADGKAGWVILLPPHEFDRVLEGQSRKDLLDGNIRPDALVPPDVVSPSQETTTPGGGFAHFGVTDIKSPLVAPWTLVATSTQPIEGYPRIGERLQADARYVYRPVPGQPETYTHFDGTWERSIVEGVWRGPESVDGGSLLVDRVVETFKTAPYDNDEKYLKTAPSAEAATEFVGATPAPRGQIYKVPAKGANGQYLQRPTWAVIHPTAVSLRGFEPALKVAPTLGKTVIFAIRETNPWGNAVLVVDGVVMPADADTPVGSIRVGTDSIVRRVRGGQDVVLPTYAYVAVDQLVDPASM